MSPDASNNAELDQFLDWLSDINNPHLFFSQVGTAWEHMLQLFIGVKMLPYS